MKILQDIIAAAVIVGMAFAFARSPKIDLLSAPQAVPGATVAPEPQQESNDTGLFQTNLSLETSNDIKARNIFAENGAYVETLNVQPKAKAYKLIGILESRDKRAIFKDEQGIVVLGAVGQKLDDGHVISSIQEDSVELQKGEEKTQLRIFDVPNRQKTILSSF